MHHFVVPAEAIAGGHVAFPAAQAHQITRVLRLRSGDVVVVLDGHGAQYRVRLAVEGRAVRGQVEDLATVCREPERRVGLLVAPPKGERWEWLLQKGTEVGVAHFVPIVTRYSQPGAAAVKPRHRDIVREATEQCRRLLVPSIAEPQPMARALAAAARDGVATTILLWEGVREATLAAVLRPVLAARPSDLLLVIGPEGGFHPDEVALARDLAIPVAGLGPLILRTETASIVAAAVALAG